MSSLEIPERHGTRFAGRNVTGADLYAIGEMLGLNKRNLQWLFALTPSDNKLMLGMPTMPVFDPALGILTRFLSQYPERMPLDPLPTAKELYEYINRFYPLKMHEFALAFGRETSSSYRWITKGGKQPPLIKHIVWTLWKQFQAAENDEQRRQIWVEWLSCVYEEAEARGIEDLGCDTVWHRVRRDEAEKAYQEAKQSGELDRHEPVEFG